VKIFLIILSIFFTVNVNAQLWNNLMIKTHPLRDIFAVNPNLGIEKILFDKLSFEVEFTYKNNDFNYKSCEFHGFGPVNSTGYRGIAGIKYYFLFGKKRIIPNSFYFLAQAGYADVKFKNINYCNGSVTNSVFLDDIFKAIEFNLVIGREFKIYKKIYTEINAGVTYTLEDYKRYYAGTSNLYEAYNYPDINFYMNWTVGYLISKDKTE